MRIAACDFGLRTWDVFISPFALHGVDITDLDVLDQVPAALQAALQREVLVPQLHWLRLMHQRTTTGEARCEVLLDNDPWTAGTQALAGLAWPQHGAWSAHSMVLLDVRDY
jgi:hypothetical protein